VTVGGRGDLHLRGLAALDLRRHRPRAGAAARIGQRDRFRSPPLTGNVTFVGAAKTSGLSAAAG
jgi:hypothetical protein